MKKFSVLVLVALVAFAAGFVVAGRLAPEESVADAQQSASGGSGSPMLDRIKERGKLLVGVNAGGTPAAFVDDTGAFMGYDPDFARKMAEELDVEIEFVDVDAETRIPAVTSGRVDVVFSTVTGNLTRAQVCDFSIPYLRVGVKMFTRAGLPYTTIEDLNTPEARIAVSRGSTGEELAVAKAPNAQIIYVNGFAEQCLQLEQEKADAAFEDNTAVDYVVKNSGGKLVGHDKLYTSDPICIAMPKGDLEFVRWVDMFVSWQITQGFAAESYEKWWGMPSTENMATIW